MKRLLGIIGVVFMVLAGIAVALPRAEALGIGSPAVGPPMPQTNVGGPIITDTTWTAAESPYVITSNLTVASGVTLTIEPGVEVKLDDGLYLQVVYLQVDGTLVARGTVSQPITFTSGRITPTASAWGYILFVDTSVDATFDGAGNYTGGSVLQYATVAYAGSRGEGAIWLENASPYIDHCTIRNNSRRGIYGYSSSGLRITNNTIANNTAFSGGGIRAYGTATISNNTIANNTASGGYGGGIRASGTATISGNTIANNTAGFGGGICTSGGTATISGNTIANNSAAGYGGGIYASGGTATISGNTIANNTASYGGGICTYDSTATISDNTIANNTAPYRGGGVYAYGSTVTITGTNFLANSLYTVYNGSTWAITATHNWWGTTSTAAIDAQIYDYSDDASKGIVWYSPFLTAPNTAVLSLRVSFQGGTGSGTSRWANVVTTTLTGGDSAGTYVVTTTNTGAYTLAGIVPGVYTITVASPHTLASKRTGVVITAPSTTVDMCALREGDANMDGQVNIADFGILAASYLKNVGQPGYNWMADFDKGGQVNIADFGLLASNYLRTRPITCPY